MTLMGIPQNEGGNQVNSQTDGCNDDGLNVLDGLGLKNPFNRTKRHHACDTKQKYGACKTCQDFYFPSAEGKSRIFA